MLLREKNTEYICCLFDPHKIDNLVIWATEKQNLFTFHRILVV